VIEFEQVTATGDPEQTRIVLQDGRQVIAALPYRELRQLLIDSRSGLATALSS
jgi:hypothetical protein